MKNILTLLRLEFKNKFGDFSYRSGKSWAKLGATLIFLALILVIVYIGATTLFSMFDKAGMAYEALVLLFTILFVYLIVSGTSSTIKVLYYKGDNEILMRFPVTGAQIFVSKTLFLFITQLFSSLIVTLPFLYSYSRVILLPGSFMAMLPVTIVFLVLIPFFLSNILAIPMMHLTNRIRNKFVILIIGMSLLMSLVFAVYMLVFDKIITFLKDSSFSVFSAEVVEIIKGVVRYFIPTKYFADIMLGNNLLISYAVLGGLLVFFLIGMILVIAKLYQKTLLKNIEIEGSAFRRKTRMRVLPIALSILHKEFIQVFRSINYGFQYFVMACSMPVMVYFCNKIATNIGRNDVGDQISLGLTLLVMLIFMTIITSFASTSVSREGRNFYQTKVLPVSIHKQMAVKFLMYMIVSVLANVICIGMLIFLKQMDFYTGLWVFGIVQSSAVALTLYGMRMDINHPVFNMSGEGEVVSNSANTTGAVILGFIISILEGIFGMVLAYISTLQMVYIVCSAIAALFLAISFVVYFAGMEKQYNRIAK
jgi:ABC-2 type transport system permease protein